MLADTLTAAHVSLITTREKASAAISLKPAPGPQNVRQILNFSLEHLNVSSSVSSRSHPTIRPAQQFHTPTLRKAPLFFPLLFSRTLMFFLKDDEQPASAWMRI